MRSSYTNLQNNGGGLLGAKPQVNHVTDAINASFQAFNTSYGFRPSGNAPNNVPQSLNNSMHSSNIHGSGVGIPS
jgi:hypothetical protein